MEKRKTRSFPPRHQDEFRFGAYAFESRRRLFLSILFAIITIAMGLFYWLPMSGIAGAVGFPYDDAWIALTFARNLIEHGVYAVHADAVATSGSTAPLMVLLFAGIGFVTGVSETLSLLLGIVAFAIASVAVFHVGLQVFREEQWFAVVVAVLFVLSPYMSSTAMSGTSTMPYIALIVSAVAAYLSGRMLLFFICSGLALWLRPDALVFVLAAAVHVLYNRSFATRSRGTTDVVESSTKGIVFGAGIMIVLLASYAAFNLLLSGTLFPNAVYARIAYYSGASNTFWGDVWQFHSSSMNATLLPFVVFAMILVVNDVLRRRRSRVLVFVAYFVGTMLAYSLFFPFVLSSLTFIPTLPFFFLLGVYGVRQAVVLLLRMLPISPIRIVAGALAILVFGASVVFAAADWDRVRIEHTRGVRYLLQRPVVAAKWLSRSTKATTRVATHHPGAMSYYSERYIVDITGLVSPEVIPVIGDLKGLNDVLKRENIEFIAAQRDLFEVVNVSAYWTSDRKAPGILEIFPYERGRTLLMSQLASSLNMQAASMLNSRRYKEAYALLEQSFKIEPLSARTNTLLGVALLEMGDTARAEEFLRQALTFHDEYAPAMVPLGDILTNREEYYEAISLLEKAVRLNPSSTQGRHSLHKARQVYREDSLRREGIHTFTITR